MVLDCHYQKAGTNQEAFTDLSEAILSLKKILTGIDVELVPASLDVRARDLAKSVFLGYRLGAIKFMLSTRKLEKIQPVIQKVMDHWKIRRIFESSDDEQSIIMITRRMQLWAVEFQVNFACSRALVVNV